MEQKTFYAAIGPNIFCEEIKKENKVGTLYVPDSISVDFTFAEVISCDSGYFDNGAFVSVNLKPGDHIAFPKVAGTKIHINDRDVIRVYYKDIIAKEVIGEIVD